MGAGNDELRDQELRSWLSGAWTAAGKDELRDQELHSWLGRAWTAVQVNLFSGVDGQAKRSSARFKLDRGWAAACWPALAGCEPLPYVSSRNECP